MSGCTGLGWHESLRRELALTRWRALGSTVAGFPRNRLQRTVQATRYEPSVALRDSGKGLIPVMEEQEGRELGQYACHATSSEVRSSKIHHHLGLSGQPGQCVPRIRTHHEIANAFQRYALTLQLDLLEGKGTKGPNRRGRIGSQGRTLPMNMNLRVITEPTEIKLTVRKRIMQRLLGVGSSCLCCQNPEVQERRCSQKQAQPP